MPTEAWAENSKELIFKLTLSSIHFRATVTVNMTKNIRDFGIVGYKSWVMLIIKWVILEFVSWCFCNDCKK